jgi:hypothetical protein
MLKALKRYFKDEEPKTEQESPLVLENKFLRERADHWCSIATDLKIRMNTMKARIAEHRPNWPPHRASLLTSLEALCTDEADVTKDVIFPPTTDHKTPDKIS